MRPEVQRNEEQLGIMIHVVMLLRTMMIHVVTLLRTITKMAEF
jgi:hypothetical protein